MQIIPHNQGEYRRNHQLPALRCFRRTDPTGTARHEGSDLL
jgi:hypothetical protein